MKRAIKLLVTVPLALLLILFLLSNRQHVRLGLWPTDFSLELPLSLAILAAMGLTFLVGALIVWFGALGQRRRARRAEEAMHLLEAQVQELKARLAAQAPAPPALSPPEA